jgi:hypothetical protein
MLRILRQLNPEEMRQVALAAHTRTGAAPEEVIRSLARLCAVTTWGIFPAATDDVLLDHVGRRLGMPPMTGGPRAIISREWAILVAYLRQAWHAADIERRRAVVEQALTAWDSPSLPRPVLPDYLHEADALYGVWETLLQSSAGCRAIAVATETEPLHLPGAAMPPPGPFRVTGARPGQGHQALYSVLLILWRARYRMLYERRARRAQLERQARQVESLMKIRQRDLEATPPDWRANPASGLSLVAAATTAVGLHLAMAPAELALLIPAAVVGTAGFVWATASSALRPGPTSDRRITRMTNQVQSCRSQLAQIERDILHLGGE